MALAHVPHPEIIRFDLPDKTGAVVPYAGRGCGRDGGGRICGQGDLDTRDIQGREIETRYATTDFSQLTRGGRRIGTEAGILARMGGRVPGIGLRAVRQAPVINTQVLSGVIEDRCQHRLGGE